MQPEGLYPHSQAPAIYPYPQLDLFYASMSQFLKINFNIISSSTPRNYWSLFQPFQTVLPSGVSLPLPFYLPNYQPFMLLFDASEAVLLKWGLKCVCFCICRCRRHVVEDSASGGLSRCRRTSQGKNRRPFTRAPSQGRAPVERKLPSRICTKFIRLFYITGDVRQTPGCLNPWGDRGLFFFIAVLFCNGSCAYRLLRNQPLDIISVLILKHMHT